MAKLLLYGLGCAVAPYLVARLYPLLRGVTRPMVYLLVIAQLLVVPVRVALDPDIDFGSQVYSLAAGLSMMLILTVEAFFAAGSAAGLLAALAHLRQRERDDAHARWRDIQSELDELR